MARTFCHQESPPLRAGSPKPGKQGERFCFPLLLPTHTFFHKQLFFRIIELLEPDPAGIPPHPTGSMRSWDNSLFIHAESWIPQSDLESVAFFQVASVLRQTEIIRPPHSEKLNMPLNNNFLVNTSSSFLITEIPPEKKWRALPLHIPASCLKRW